MDKLIAKINEGAIHFRNVKAQIKQEFINKNINPETLSKAELVHIAIMGMGQSDNKNFQDQITNWAKENKLPELAKEALERHPEKRTEIQRRIIAFMGEGETLENSIL